LFLQKTKAVNLLFNLDFLAQIKHNDKKEVVMVFKPMDEREFRRHIKVYGWSLRKSGVDYSLLDENGNYVCSIKITHGKRTKGSEIIAHCVQKTGQMLKIRGQQWPPKKK
jgi:hypothetical protein